MELNSGNLGSRCEAVIAVLQGLMSSKVELVPGGMTGDVTGLELAEVCQQSHGSVMGCNTWSGTHVGRGKPGVGLSEAGFLRADRMFMNMPSVGTGDSSSSSEMGEASSGSDLHILRRLFSFQT